MANANTDNGSGVTLSEIPGVWLNGSFTPRGPEGRQSPAARSMLVLHATGAPPLQCRQGDRDAGRPADLRRRAIPRESVSHCRRDTGSRLFRGLLPGVHQLARVHRSQRHHEHAWGHCERDGLGLPGAGEHQRDDQPTHHCVWRFAHHVERPDRIVARIDMAVDMERCGGQPGRPGKLRCHANSPAVFGEFRTQRRERPRLHCVHAGAALPTRLHQRLDVFERHPLDCGPLDQPQRTADLHDRGRGCQRDTCPRPRDLPRHHRRVRREVDAHPDADTPGGFRRCGCSSDHGTSQL